MRTQQYHDALYKEFQKHPDNPFNQVWGMCFYCRLYSHVFLQLTVAYDATKEDKLDALQSKRSATEKRLGSRE